MIDREAVCKRRRGGWRGGGRGVTGGAGEPGPGTGAAGTQAMRPTKKKKRIYLHSYNTRLYLRLLPYSDFGLAGFALEEAGFFLLLLRGKLNFQPCGTGHAYTNQKKYHVRLHKEGGYASRQRRALPLSD